MFGYSLVNTEKYRQTHRIQACVFELQRWLSGFKDLDILWNWMNGQDYRSTDAVRNEYARARETSVYGRDRAEIEVERLSRELEAAKISTRYALATFRALSQYTFEDSDHGLLIAEAVKKLESVDDK